MTATTATIAGTVLSAGFIFLVLRFFSANAHQANRSRNISSHAFWTAIVALVTSGVMGLSNLWAITPENHYNESSLETRIMHAAAPGLWLGIVYIIGQFTWPRHLKPVRSASLEVRSAKTLIPRALAGILLCATLLSAVAIAFSWNEQGVPQRLSSSAQQSFDYGTDDEGNYVDENGNLVDETSNLLDEDGNILDEYGVEDQTRSVTIDGVLPGDQVAPYLAGGLLLVVISITTASTVIVRRPPLQPLDAENNDTLRRIWLNRLLRTGILVSAGFGAMSMQYKASATSAREQWANLETIDGYGNYSSGTSTDWLQTGSGLGMLALAITMLVWAPPRLPSFISNEAHFESRGRQAPISESFTKARDFLTLTQGVIFLVLLIASIIPGMNAGSTESVVWSTSIVDGMEVQQLVQYSGPSFLELTRSSMLSTFALAAAYLVLQLIANYSIKKRLCHGLNLDEPQKKLLPDWFWVATALAVAIGLAFILAFAFNAPRENAPIVGWGMALMGGVAGLAALVYRGAARRAPLAEADAFEDYQIRVIVAHRGVRVLGGVSLIVAGLVSSYNGWTPAPYADYVNSDGGFDPSGLQIFLIGIGLALCFLPAASVISAEGFKNQPTGAQHV